MSDDCFTIKKVYDRKTKEELDVDKLCFDSIIHEYSNTKKRIFRLFHDNVLITRNNSFMCEYECKTCSRLQVVTLNNMCRKKNKNIMFCMTCKEHDPDKSHPGEKQSLYDRLLNDQKDFDKEDDDFKMNYFRKHLSNEEFMNLSSKIRSFQNDKFSNLEDFEYFPCVKIGNQNRFNPYLYDKTRDVLEKCCYIKFVCECCGSTFKSRDLFSQKNKYKLLCNDCSFTNNILKIRYTTTFSGKRIRFQSHFEKKFIDFCNENEIEIENGPNVSYTFDKQRVYRVGFQLPSIKFLIEVQDNHTRHKKQIEDGKWESKINAVKTFLVNNEQYNQFLMIYPRNFADIKKYILKKINKI